MQRVLDAAPQHLHAARPGALARMDIDWGRRMFPGAPDADIEIAMHKARYHATDLPRELRHASAQWLRERRHLDVLGLPILPPGQLPL